MKQPAATAREAREKRPPRAKIKMPGASLHPGAARSMPYLKRIHTFNDPKQVFPRLKTDVTRINGAFKAL